MRSARMLLATATATAALVVSAPTAFSVSMDDGEHDKSSYSKEHDKDSSHDKPHGGIHTGGGALVAVSEGGWSGERDKEESKEESKGEDKYEGKDEDKDKDKDKDEDEKKDWGHGKPSGGVHAGGGALAAVSEGGWSGERDKEESKEESKGEDKYEGKYEGKDEDEKKDWGHGKPSGGVHAGGGALAAVSEDGWSGERDKEESKEESKGEDKCEGKGKDEDEKEDWGHGKPSGGVHAGGGALAAVSEDGWSGKHDKEESKDEDKDGYEGKKDWEHEKPSGGVHTGGGGLSDPGVSGGSLAALAVLGAGAYALRRKKASGSAA
ncbi:hypothetical protein [Streptomyces sp. KMM 9044]|uniref:hypothetical protein n=1 Tax=Streptomyces sp. KMM 9044 TaxID=2744474 RepID=UPI00215194D7|nr:hypothetical protein [Streptomyces sp. KMM 9044]WAX81422.1 hypothetical protein HUV60_031060 [Streptomyces sp. KMM 9044]